MTPRDDDAPGDPIPDRPSRRFAVVEDMSACPPECQRRWEQQRKEDLSRAQEIACHTAQLSTGASTFNRIRNDIADAKGLAEREARAVREDHDRELADVRGRLEKEADKVRERVEAAERAHAPKPTPWLAIISVSSVLILALCGALWNLAVRVQERPTAADVDAKMAVVAAVQAAQTSQAADIKVIRESLDTIKTDVGTLKTDVAVLKTDVAVLKATAATPPRRVP